jgi:pimeloyl-ACP methyl ester carboxylesterase
MMPRPARFLLVVMAACLMHCSPAPQPARRFEAAVPRVDGTLQSVFVMLPEGFGEKGPPRPLLVSLHSWSADYTQRHEELEQGALERGWIYLFPDFRGPNGNPAACGSELAQQDILDAVAWAKSNYPVDESRVHLTGSSGGGHMTLLMAGRYPEVWTAASAWVPISDLTAWHARHADGRYGAMLRACTGGAPGWSEEADREYRARSPLTWLANAAGLPLDIAAGIRDGHEGSVPIRHTLEAFNVIARAAGATPVSEEEIAELSASPAARLSNPRPSDREADPSLARTIYLRRTAGKARATVFEGGHEAVASAQLAWLERHSR